MEIPATVVPYDPGWPSTFEALRRRVASALGGIEHRVEHVGSTAVPGLDAKPIIDIDVIAPGQADVAMVIAALTASGWQHQGDLGIEGREAFSPPADGPYHHLYVVVQGGQPHRDHVDLRDFLRSHPAAAAQYAALKHRLAPALAADRSAYVDAKSALITDLLGRARA